MRFEDLRPHIVDSEHLVRLFEDHRAALLEQMGRRLIATMTLVVAGFLLPGAWGLTALSLTLPAALACVWSMVEHSGCGWFLQLATLHDVMRPREPLLRFDVDPAPYREDTRPGG